MSLSTEGEEGNEVSGLGKTAISRDGSVVAFVSRATNLVPGGTNGHWHVFVRDRRVGTTELVSLSSLGAQANAGSFNPSLSADGRFVVFESDASNLVSGDDNGVRDIFVRDREKETTERVSVGPLGSQADGASRNPSISADGRLVAFESAARNVTLDQIVINSALGLTGSPGFMVEQVINDSVPHVYVRDRKLGWTERVSVNDIGSPADRGGSSPSISADGRHVAFVSGAHNLIFDPSKLPWPWDTPPEYLLNEDHAPPDHVYVRDLHQRKTEAVSVDSDGDWLSENSAEPAISADGRYVVFTFDSRAESTCSRWCVYIRDRLEGVTEFVDVDTQGDLVPRFSSRPSISDNGRLVVFQSNDPFGEIQFGEIQLRDRVRGTTTLVSVNSAGDPANAGSTNPALSGDGRHVAFSSHATNLVDEDLNGTSDVFVHSLCTVGSSQLPCSALPAAATE